MIKWLKRIFYSGVALLLLVLLLNYKVKHDVKESMAIAFTRGFAEQMKTT